MAAPFLTTTLDADHGWDPLNDGPVVALNNCLAAAPAVTDVTRESLAAIEAEFRVSLTADYTARLEELYKDFIGDCLADKRFTQDEVNGIWHLKWLFNIPDERHSELYRRIATEAYLRSVDEVMSDFTVSAAEKRFLAELGEYLDLPAELRDLAFDTRAQMMLHDAFDVAKSDGQLTDQELEQLRLLQKQLGKSLDLSDEDRAAYQRARLIWVIKHAPTLAPLAGVPLQLPATEHCYYRHRATFILSPRRADQPLAVEARRAKLETGAFWNDEVGELPDSPQALDTGEVFLTNRHLWLAGRTHKSELGLHLIEDFDACPAGVNIRCAHGKRLRLMMTKQVDVFAHYLARMLRDA